MLLACEDDTRVVPHLPAMLEHRFKKLFNMTVLHAICGCNATKVLSELIASHPANLDLDVVDVRGATPLLVAISKRAIDAVDILLRAGANANRRARSRNEATACCCAEGMTLTSIELLLTTPFPEEDDTPCFDFPLHEAVDNSDHEEEEEGGCAILSMLILAVDDVNRRSHNGETALHVAARCDNATAVRVLLDAGADTNAVDNTGKTAADVSASEVTRSHIAAYALPRVD